MVNASALRVQARDSVAYLSGEIERRSAEGDLSVIVASAVQLDRVLAAVQRLGLEVVDPDGLTWHREPLLATTHGRGTRSDPVVGTLLLRRHSIELETGAVERIAEAPHLGPRARVLTYRARVEPSSLSTNELFARAVADLPKTFVYWPRPVGFPDLDPTASSFDGGESFATMLDSAWRRVQHPGEI